MFEAQGKIKVGKRWQSERSRYACERCRALGGKEFYFAPGPGQRSISEMPQAPLHPNCRCSVEDITDYAKVMREQNEWGEDDARKPVGIQPSQDKPTFESQGASPRLHEGAAVAFGVYWCNDGRKVWDGPAYGNWGGQNWGGGRNTTGVTPKDFKRLAKAGQLMEHIDEMDKFYQFHDECYMDARGSSNQVEEEFSCDRKLVERLNSLPDDPNDKRWENKRPKSEQEKEYARRFRAYATWYFEGRLNWHDVDYAEDETRMEWSGSGQEKNVH